MKIWFYIISGNVISLLLNIVVMMIRSEILMPCIYAIIANICAIIVCIDCMLSSWNKRK